jgi:hypothetical protein
VRIGRRRRQARADIRVRGQRVEAGADVRIRQRRLETRADVGVQRQTRARVRIRRQTSAIVEGRAEAGPHVGVRRQRREARPDGGIGAEARPDRTIRRNHAQAGPHLRVRVGIRCGVRVLGAGRLRRGDADAEQKPSEQPDRHRAPDGPDGHGHLTGGQGATGQGEREQEKGFSTGGRSHATTLTPAWATGSNGPPGARPGPPAFRPPT